MFQFSNKSKERLASVHPALQRVVVRALELSSVDFSVVEGARSITQQQENVHKGVSKTMKSKHLVHADGYAYAVDLYPYPYSDDINDFYPIVTAMRKAAKELNTKIRWGGCWCELNSDTRLPKDIAEQYTAVRRKAGNTAFIDGPHFELVGG